jgi:hypothetical protein
MVLMRVRTSLISFAAAALLASPLPAKSSEGQALAPEQASQNPTFSLSAMVNARAQLSRKEVDPAAMNFGPTTAQIDRSVSAMSMPPSAPQPAPQMFDQAARLAALAAQTRLATLQGQASQDDTPGAFLKEYNVDWSRWVSLMADRWFYVLRNTEYQLGVQFQTPRPALIQFTCYADGTIGNIILKQSSGVTAYDRLQVASLLQAVPTPPFPPGTHRTSITLVQGWESHPRQPGEHDFQPGSFGRDFPLERVRKWCAGL